MIPLVYHSVLLHAVYMNIVMNVEIQNNNSNINNDDVNVHIIPEIVPFWLQEEKKTKEEKWEEISGRTIIECGRLLIGW